jgi:hypothetical protein
MLDSLSPLARHFILLVAPVVIGFASTDLIPLLQGVNPIAATFAAALLTQAALILTSLTTAVRRGFGLPHPPVGPPERSQEARRAI